MKSKDLQSKSNYTTIEQSKQLLELGLPSDSADCVYELKQVGTKMIMSSIPDVIPNTMKLTWNDKRIPCWSVGQIIEIMNVCSICGHVSIHRTDREVTQIDQLIEILQNRINSKTIDFSKYEIC